MESWWERRLSAYTAAAHPPPAAGAAYDAVVVGAGLVGLGAATRLAQARPQWRVALLEAGARLANASTRNAGFACFGTAGEVLDELRTSSAEQARARLEARYRGLQHLLATLGPEAMGYEPCGGYELFERAEAHAAAVAFLPTLNGWLAPLSGRAQVYAPTVVNGLLAIANPLEGAVDSGALLQAAVERALAAGVRLHLGAAVAARAPGGLRLHSGAAVSSPRVLLCTNAHTATLAPSAVAPGRGYVWVSPPLPGSLSGSWPWRGTFHLEAGYVYFRHLDTAQGPRLLLGGARHLALEEERSLEPAVNARIRRYLRDFAVRVLGLPPALADDTDAEAAGGAEWVGIMGFAGGEGPELRRVAPGQWVAAGLGGMGVARGLAYGAEAADALLAEA